MTPKDIKISVVIPCYEMRGNGVLFLRELLSSIETQTHKNVEIIVPDHSVESGVVNECATWASRLNIVHFFNDRKRGNSSANMNDGIRKATGSVIKVMHMDDFFCNPNAMEKIVNAVVQNPSLKWGCLGFNHLHDGGEIRNYITGRPGNPSTSFILRNESDLDLFDENLVVLNDADMNKRLQIKYGNGMIISDICVTIRMHKDNFAKLVDGNREFYERLYMQEKYQNRQ